MLVSRLGPEEAGVEEGHELFDELAEGGFGAVEDGDEVVFVPGKVLLFVADGAAVVPEPVVEVLGLVMGCGGPGFDL